MSELLALIELLMLLSLMIRYPCFSSTSEVSYELREVLFLEYRGDRDSIVKFIEVPVPPNTSWQESRIIKSDPPSFQLITCGPNTFLRFRLVIARFKQACIKVICRLRIKGAAHFPSLSLSFASYLDSLHATSLSRFTLPTKWWNYTDPVVVRVIDAFNVLLSLNMTLGEVLDSLRRYIQKHMKYTQLRYRRGASNVLRDFRGDCSEYADVFITIARSLGIPARRVWGWVLLGYVAGKPVFSGHAWVEVWLPGERAWMPLETTFLNETSINLELGMVPENYIAFYIEDGVNDIVSPMIPDDEGFLLGSEEWTRLKDDVWFSSSINIQPVRSGSFLLPAEVLRIGRILLIVVLPLLLIFLLIISLIGKLKRIGNEGS